MPAVESETYIFQDYPAGVQYGEESHTLSDIVTMHISSCWLHEDNLRIYSSETNNGTAIIESLLPIKSIGFNAGNKTDTLNIYGSDDGVSWTLLKGVEITATTYNDYQSGEFAKAYKWLKLDVAGENQVRLESMTLNFEQVAEEPKAVLAEGGKGYDTVEEALTDGATRLQYSNGDEMPFQVDVTVGNTTTTYIGLEDGDYYSYYELTLKMSSISLRASEAGIYYGAKVVCDNALAAKVTSYGIVLSTETIDTENPFEGNPFTVIEGTVDTTKTIRSGSVFNIFEEGREAADNVARGETSIYAAVYLRIGNEVVISNQVNWSLRSVVETIDTAIAADGKLEGKLDADQEAALAAFYKKWADVITDWKIDNIKNLGVTSQEA